MLNYFELFILAQVMLYHNHTLQKQRNGQFKIVQVKDGNVVLREDLAYLLGLLLYCMYYFVL